MMNDTEYCGRGVCAAMEGHEGTCAEASGWDEAPEANHGNALVAEIATAIRRNCTAPSDLIGKTDALVAFVADWIENPPAWVNVSYRNAEPEGEPAHLSAQEAATEVEPPQEDRYSSGQHLRVVHQGRPVCDTCTNVLGLNVRWDQARCRAGVVTNE